MKWGVYLLLSLILLGCQERSPKNYLVYERIIDGDTFVASGQKIRLWGIDAAEKNEPEFLASTLYLEVLLEQGALECVFKHKDRYKRDVMQCFSDGYDIAADLVKNGMATDFERYSGGYYQELEAEAKAQEIGIWKGSRI